MGADGSAEYGDSGSEGRLERLGVGLLGLQGGCPIWWGLSGG